MCFPMQCPSQVPHQQPVLKQWLRHTLALLPSQGLYQRLETLTNLGSLTWEKSSTLDTMVHANSYVSVRIAFLMLSWALRRAFQAQAALDRAEQDRGRGAARVWGEGQLSPELLLMPCSAL